MICLKEKEEEESSTVTPAKEPLSKKSKDYDTYLDIDDDGGQRKMCKFHFIIYFILFIIYMFSFFY